MHQAAAVLARLPERVSPLPGCRCLCGVRGRGEGRGWAQVTSRHAGCGGGGPVAGPPLSISAVELSRGQRTESGAGSL